MGREPKTELEEPMYSEGLVQQSGSDPGGHPASGGWGREKLPAWLITEQENKQTGRKKTVWGKLGGLYKIYVGILPAYYLTIFKSKENLGTDVTQITMELHLDKPIINGKYCKPKMHEHVESTKHFNSSQAYLKLAQNACIRLQLRMIIWHKAYFTQVESLMSCFQNT